LEEHVKIYRKIVGAGWICNEKEANWMGKAALCLSFLMILSGCWFPAGAPAPAAIDPWYPQSNENGDPVFAVFECRLPCDDCEKIKFGLALYRDRETRAPTTYMMTRVYVGDGDDRLIDEGTWTIVRGTGLDPQAVIYRLDSNAPREFRSYWAIGQDILFILDQELIPRVGNAGYGYVLNLTH
jgi:hypothetical protein